MSYSKTLAAPVSFNGIGVHSGRPACLRLLPSRRPGIMFRRSDLGNAELSLDSARVEARNGTVLQGDSFSVRTVEHLLAALWIPGIDALIVEMDGDEVPIMDGSAEPFARAIQSAGVDRLPSSRGELSVVKPFRLEEEGAEIVFSPAEPGRDLEATYTIVFPHPAIGEQTLRRPLRWDVFIREIAPARTFGFYKDADGLRARGLSLGSSFENSVVLDETAVMNGPLRFPDEFVRHKLLDLAGDLALLGRPLRACVSAVKAGHRLHHRAVRYLLDHPDLCIVRKD